MCYLFWLNQTAGFITVVDSKQRLFGRRRSVVVLALAGSVLSVDGSFLFIFLSILCLIFILNRTLFKPINQVLDERERLGAGRLEEAKRLLAQHEVRLSGYEAQMQKARADAYQQLEAQRREAQAARAELVAQARAEVAGQVEGARQDIARQTESAKTKLEQDARAMAAAIASQLLQRPIGGGGK
jgi:F-type H+-transporting ATPase subunit b